MAVYYTRQRISLSKEEENRGILIILFLDLTKEKKTHHSKCIHCTKSFSFFKRNN